jgi:hypothetical protein
VIELLRLLMVNPWLRQSLGLTAALFGVIGSAFPIIPGWPAFLLAALLLGRRNPIIRRPLLLIRRTLRTLRHTRHPSVRDIGRRLSFVYVETRRLVLPRLIAVERQLSR